MPRPNRARSRSTSPLASLFEVHEATLKNGLRVRVVPNNAAPVVSLYTFFRVGSRNERPGITGISHLFEHMMFNGAKKYGPKEFDRVLESQGGRSNAYTSNDWTVYHEEFASEALETVFDLESDRMRSLAISDRMLKSEREVVKEERRSRVDNDITGMMDEELSTLVFKAHPYRWPVIGWMSDIDAITRQDCEQYFRTYYAPNNATLVVAGDVEPKKTLALIQRYYGSIPKGPAAPSVPEAEPNQKGERRAIVQHPAQAPAVMVAFRGPKGSTEDALVLDVLQYALAVGESSRLTRELVYGKELAVGVMMDWAWRIDPGMLIFFLELKPDSKADQVEAALYAEIGRIAESGIEPRELEKAKNNLKSHLMNELSTNSGRAHALGSHELLLGDWREVLELPARYEAVTGEQVKAAAQRFFAQSQRSVVTLQPLAEMASEQEAVHA